MAISRQDTVLKCIVEEFISTAQPVGSNTLIKKYNLPFSSATIRNDMAELEQKGYLEKTHTSSGRVPSAKGYSYYAEHIKNSVSTLDVDAEFKKEFQMILSKKSQSVEDVLNKSCKILSEVTSMAAVVLGPKADTEHLLFVNSTTLADKTQMSVYLMTDKGFTDSKTFIVHSPEEAASVSKCIEIINNRLTGSSIGSLKDKVEAMKPILAETIGHSSEIVVDALAEAFLNFAKQRAKTYGSKNLVELPEYEQDSKQLQAIIDLINDPNKIAELVDGNTTDGISLNVSTDDSSNVAIVSQECNISNIDTKLAIIGPQRMDYKKIMSMLHYMVYKLNEYFQQEDSDSNKEGE